MKRSIHTWIAFLLLGLAGGAAAQSSLELVGFGMDQSPGDAVSQGIGGIVTVPEGSRGWLYAAPSTWHHIRLTRLYASLEASQSHLGDLGTFTRAGPQNFQFLVHVNRRTSYGIGVRPVTRVDLALRDTTGVATLDQDTLRYTQSRSSVGGLSAFRLGFSKQIRPGISLGVVLDILFGSLTQSDTLEFTKKGDRDYLPLNIWGKRRFEFNGQMLGLSLLAACPPEDRGQLGLQVLLPLNMKLVDYQTYINKWNYLSLDPLRYRRVGLPRSYAVGYGVNVARKHHIMAEIGYTHLVPAKKNDLAFGQYVKATGSVRAGWSRVPSGDERFTLGRLYYRMGFYRMDYYLSGWKKGPLAEVAFTIGAGFKTGGFGHGVDLAFQVGRRDSLLEGVQFENFYRLSLGIATAELWFVRPKKKWD